MQSANHVCSFILRLNFIFMPFHKFTVSHVPHLFIPLLFWLVTSTAAGLQTSSSSSDGRGQLNLIRLSSNYLEAEFYTQRTGIYIKSADMDSARASYLTISTHAGKNIFSITASSKDTMFVSMMDREYLFSRPSQTKARSLAATQYRVTKSQSGLLLRLLRSGLPLTSLARSKYLQSDGVQEGVATDLLSLLTSEEGGLIQQAAVELGRRGVLGRDSSGCMAFYMLAIRLTEMQSQFESGRGECGGAGTNKRRSKGKNGVSVDVRDSGELCAGKRPRLGECVPEGVCGAGCKCWEMVCGDCCQHRGCLGLRRCGQGCRPGQVSYDCFNLFGFKCDYSKLTC